MPSRFRLQQVLNYRERVEGIAQQELATLEQQRQLALETLQLQEQQAVRQRTSLAALRTHGALDPPELERATAYLGSVRAAIEAQRERIAELEQHIALSRDALIEAARERRTLEQLKEREGEAAQLAEQRREARELDELVMQRAQRSRDAWEV